MPDLSSAPRQTGILVPVFALRRNGDLGIGDTAALRRLCDWAAQSGVGFLQLLPINETGPDHSPYNAISSVALDPLHLEMSPSSIPGLTAFDVEAARARLPREILDGPYVDYPAVGAAKRALLETAYRRFSEDALLAAPVFASARRSFHAFCADEKDWLDDYCAFRYFMDEQGGSEVWDQWPETIRTPELARRRLETGLRDKPEETSAKLGFYAYVQWVAYTQWKATRAYAEARGVRLMGDIPIGVSYYSADVFFQPEQFDLEWSGGAPPEPIFKDDLFVQKWGQNWGIPLYRWDAMQADGFTWWKRRIRKLTDVFQLFRIDHVLGFYRIYAFPWRPQRNEEFLPLDAEEAARRTNGRRPGFLARPDDTPCNQSLNLADGDQRIRMIQEAAGSAEVVAEDLGMVPDYVRPHLLERGIPGFKIPQWECSPEGHAISGADYPECSFTTICTHDHEAMKSLWERWLREARAESGDPGDQWSARENLRHLMEFTGVRMDDGAYPSYDTEWKWMLISALLRSRSRYAALLITDLFGMEERFNVPGVLDPRNWRVRLPWDVEALFDDPSLARESARLLEASRESSRAR